MVIITGDKIANLEKLNKSEKTLLDFIVSIGEVGHRESYNSLLKKFVKIDEKTDTVKVRQFFTPSKIHAICYTVAQNAKKSEIIPYCEFNADTGDFLLVYGAYDKKRIEKTYAKKENKSTTFDPLKMCVGLLTSEKYTDYWFENAGEKLQGLQSALTAIFEELQETEATEATI